MSAFVTSLAGIPKRKPIMGRPIDQRWAAKLVAANRSIDQDNLVSLVAERVVAERVAAERSVDRSTALTVPDEPPGGWLNPWLIGLVHEQAAHSVERKQRGAWYTPRLLVCGLVRAAFDAYGTQPPVRVLDPTCGGGAFLLAALDELVQRGVEPLDALARVRGSDVDGGAVAASRLSLAAWAALHEVASFDPATAVFELDALTACAFADPPQLVIGNPPFASPLHSGAIPAAAADYRSTNDDVLGPYADLASMHLHRALGLVENGAVVSLVLPQSTLSSRDVASLRAYCDNAAALKAAWATDVFVFEAGVRVWAPAFQVGAAQAEVVVSAEPDPIVVGVRSFEGWGPLVADALGAPPVELPRGSDTLAAIATATAGFRDEYYGLAEACVDGDVHEIRLVTVGAIDPLFCGWGSRPIKFASQQWATPTIDRALVEGKVARWLDGRLVPKVLLPTQTKVLEPFVDRSGLLAPSTPLIAVHAAEDQLDRIAAVLLAPPVVAWLYRRCFGAAMSGDSIKVSAKMLLEVPLPDDKELWQQAAEIVGASPGTDHLQAWHDSVNVARMMNDAYGADSSTLGWWLDRLGPVPAN